jgi:uncharacterized membrane protein YkoI
MSGFHPQNPLMRNLTIQRCLCLAVALIALGATAARADDDDDHELARQLHQQGRILALADVMKAVQAEVPGEVLEVEFEAEHGAHVYEFKILRSDGKVQEVEADAATGKITKIEDDD